MKIRFKQRVILDVEKVKLEEMWDKTYNKWDEIRVDSIHDLGPDAVDLITYEGDVIRNVCRKAFEVVT